MCVKYQLNCIVEGIFSKYSKEQFNRWRSNYTMIEMREMYLKFDTPR